MKPLGGPDREITLGAPRPTAPGRGPSPMDDWTLAGLLYLAVELVGIASAVHVLLQGRTPQGAIAWLFFLVTLPVAAVPLYWVFGPRRYEGYLGARLEGNAVFDPVAEQLRASGERFFVDEPERPELLVALERLVRLPFLSHNRVELLVDGERTFDAIVEAIEAAEQYVLVQFYIVRDDAIGRRLASALTAAAGRGVAVHFLFDGIGSATLDGAFLNRLREAGVEVHAFATASRSHRLQLNFRNHRKVVVVDGTAAFTGGLNVGDEYLGGDPRLSPWRDTFVRVTGPAALAVQLSFLEDWHWATDELPDWRWQPVAAPDGSDRSVLVLPTGPADPLESCSLMFVGLIHRARERLWIATPYFVFDQQITSALQLAALRGVDVRVLLPAVADHAATHYAGWSYFDEVLESGCRIFRFTDGFSHQKVVLVDSDLALVGSANLDNRSMRLNFELGVLVESEAFAGEVEAMLEADLDRCIEAQVGEFADKPLTFRRLARLALLFAPIL